MVSSGRTASTGDETASLDDQDLGSPPGDRKSRKKKDKKKDKGFIRDYVGGNAAPPERKTSTQTTATPNSTNSGSSHQRNNVSKRTPTSSVGSSYDSDDGDESFVTAPTRKISRRPQKYRNVKKKHSSYDSDDGEESFVSYEQQYRRKAGKKPGKKNKPGRNRSAASSVSSWDGDSSVDDESFMTAPSRASSTTPNTRSRNFRPGKRMASSASSYDGESSDDEGFASTFDALYGYKYTRSNSKDFGDLLSIDDSVSVLTNGEVSKSTVMDHDLAFQYANALSKSSPSRQKSVDIVDRAVYKRRLAANRPLLVIYCCLLLATLIDLATTVIGFVIWARQGDCCGEQIQFSKYFIWCSSVPLFVLILVELVLWGKGVQLLILYRPRYGRNTQGTALSTRTLSIDAHAQRTDYAPGAVGGGPTKSGNNLSKKVSRWTATFVAGIINAVTVFNPFFACVVAWMLLYQTSKLECFFVLGLEGVSLLLHFLSVWIVDQGKLSWKMTVFHSLPILPFIVILILTLVFLEQGGVCYLVDEEKFWYDGCRLCDNGEPPIDGICTITERVWSNYTDPNTLEEKSVAADVVRNVTLASSPWYATQETYCAEGASQARFCFFTY